MMHRQVELLPGVPTYHITYHMVLNRPLPPRGYDLIAE